jgi:hypothetical protein
VLCTVVSSRPELTSLASACYLAMAATGAVLFPASLSPVVRRDLTSSVGRFNKLNPVSSRRFAVSTSTEQTPVTPVTLTTTSRLSEKREELAESVAGSFEVGEVEYRSLMKDYIERSKELIRSDGGPPRWFTPLECGPPLNNSPLLLFLPGLIEVGLGLIKQHRRLGKIFETWCLHIPVMDRTPFIDLVKLVGKTIRSENCRSPNRPIYLVGESFGGCLALAAAASNPDIDLVLILANPATSFGRSQLQPLIPLLDFIPDQLPFSLPPMLSPMTGLLSCFHFFDFPSCLKCIFHFHLELT